jgi:hypothetical protein
MKSSEDYAGRNRWDYPAASRFAADIFRFRPHWLFVSIWEAEVGGQRQ